MSETWLCPRCGKEPLSLGRPNLLTAAAGMGVVVAAGGAFVFEGRGLLIQILAGVLGIVAAGSWVAALVRYHCSACGEILTTEFPDGIRAQVSRKRRAFMILGLASSVLLLGLFAFLVQRR